MKDFFTGWHKPTVCTTVVIVVVILIAYHFMHTKGSS